MNKNEICMCKACKTAVFFIPKFSLLKIQQERDKFACFTMKNRSSARFARAFVIFGHFEHVLVLSMTSNDLFCSCVEERMMTNVQHCLLNSEAPVPI